MHFVNGSSVAGGGKLELLGVAGEGRMRLGFLVRQRSELSRGLERFG